jgi:hypothetical protein
VARSVVQLTFLLAIAAAIVMARTGSAAGAGPTTPDAMKATAADSLDAALRPGGAGISFEMVSVSTLHAKPDGPRIQLYTPDDPTKILGETDEYLVGTVLSRGGVTADAFWMDMLVSPTKTADFETAELFARVLERDGKVWRDDGVGWYQVDDPPGVGMDPATARLLASMVRELGAAEKIDSARFDGRTLAGVKGTSGPDRWPGIVAADGAAFTEKSFAVECWFDETGRLVRFEASARNLNATTFDLVLTTTVTLSYGSPGDPPEPNPTMAPEPLPTSEPEAAEVRS